MIKNNQPFKLQGFGMFAAASIWGTWVLILKDITLPGFFVTAITSFTGLLGLLIYILLIKKNGKTLTQILKTPKLLRLISIVAILEAIQNALFMIALQLAVAGGGSIFIPIIRSFTGIITPLIAVKLAKKEFSPRLFIYGVLSAIGAILISSWGGLDAGERVSYLALILVITSVIISAFQYIAQRYIALAMSKEHQDEANIITFQVFLTGLFIVPLIIYYLYSTPANINTLYPQITWIGIFGLTHVALAFVLRLNALKYITASQAVIIGYLEPVISISLSVIFLKESINLGFILGAFLILASAISAGTYQTAKKLNQGK